MTAGGGRRAAPNKANFAGPDMAVTTYMKGIYAKSDRWARVKNKANGQAVRRKAWIGKIAKQL
jgi:hypothetical protein